jgi:hypothetical protein
MKYRNLLSLLKKAIEYKRSHKIVEEIVHFFEAKEIVKKGSTKLSKKDKREQLKLMYAKILSNTPFADTLPMFKKLIDQVPESYLDYETNIDLDKAMEMINELIHGTGLLTAEEMTNLGNIVAGIGIPAIEHHAAGKKSMGKEAQEFGSKEMNKNLGQFLDSIEKRRNPEKQISTTAIVPTTPTARGVPMRIEDPVRKAILRLFKMPAIAERSAFGKIVAEMQSKMPNVEMNVDRLTNSMKNIIQNSASMEDAEKKVKRTLNIDVSNDQYFTDMFREARRTQSKVKEEVKTNET